MKGRLSVAYFIRRLIEISKSELLEVRNHGNDMQHLVSSTDSLGYKAFTFMRNLLRWL